MAKKVSIRGELKKAGKGIVGEIGRQLFGGKKKKKQTNKSGVTIHNHYYPRRRK